MNKHKPEINWRQMTIENLENHDFGNPEEAPTNLVKRCQELCKVPLEQFTVEDLRLMIGQQFSLQYLIPLAIEHLREDIMAEGDLYPGDLLKSVQSIDQSFWEENKNLLDEINEIIKNQTS